jgi:hypothetical protein
MNEKELVKFIKLELESNLHVLIDPKKKDSFSDRRINTWKEIVSERIVYHLNNKIEINKNGL